MKKNLKRIMVTVTACCSAILLSACGTNVESPGNQGDDDSTVVDQEGKLKLSESSITLNLEETKQLTATTDDDSAYVFTWKSDDPTIASVDDGLVKALKEGKTKISVSIKKKGQIKVLETKSCEVTVLNRRIILSETEVTISLSEETTHQITATVSDGGKVEWSSSDEKIATVKDGLITGIAVGTATITAKSADLVATCNVTVYGNFFKLAATEFVAKGVETELVPEEGSFSSDTTWKSSDTSVVTVIDGKVTGLKKGMATITATSTKDGIDTSCVVIVKEGNAEPLELKSGKKADAAKDFGNWYYLLESDNVEVSKIPTIDNDIISMDITKIGTTGANFAYLRYQPDDTGNVQYKETLYFYSENDALASINGGADISFKAGLTKLDIDFTSTKPDDANPSQIKFKSQGQFYIIPVFEKIGAVEKMELSESSKKLDLAGEKTFKLIATIPNEENPEVEWTSTNEEVLTVSDDGNVTAVGVGSALIKAKYKNYAATCVVLVEDSNNIVEEAHVNTGNKSDAIANPEKWYYVADGVAKTSPTPTLDNDGTIKATILVVGPSGTNFAFLRYQPKDAGTYKVISKIVYSGIDGASIDISGGKTNSNTFELVDGENSFEYTFETNTSTPFQYKIKSAGIYSFITTFTKA